MRPKTYRMRGVAVTREGDQFVDLSLEFEGNRAYVIWSAIPLGGYELKARIEVNRKLLKKSEQRPYDYYYNGKLVLPRAENN